MRKPSGNLADGQVFLSYKPGAKRSQPNDPDCENAVSEGISLVEGIELTANAGEVGQSEVQLEQFWIFSKAVPPRKSARSAAFSPRIEIAVNAVS